MARGRKRNGADGAPEQSEGIANTTAGSNVRSLDTIRQECAQAIREINAQRAELNEEMGGIRERLRNAGIEPRSFMLALRIADMEDHAARDKHIEEIAETCRALGVGMQGSLFPEKPAAQPAEAEDEPDPRPAFLKQRHEEAAAP